jgi:heterodisulfide reductase subunit A
MAKKSKSVLVVGAGIAGIQASLDLAEMGLDVHLVEGTPTIGGRMPQLDKTFPTNDCSMCILSPKMSECARHPGIMLYTKAEVLSVEGEPGHFSCKVLKQAKYVDPEKCVACGLCEEKCPVKVDDEFDMGLRKRKAISRYFLQSIPAEYTIDRDRCLHLTKGVCKICEKTCPAGAIKFDDTDQEVTIRVGAVILATGIDAFNPIGFGHFGYHLYKNVMTSLEFERMLSASGPLGGHVVRPSDDKEPRKIAFIQCVGSRDVSIDKNYCSSACCMFAIKQAIIAKEHIKGLSASIFYMDIRAYGKDFDKYYDKAQNQYGVIFIRSKVAEIRERPGGSLRLKYVFEDGDIKYDDFDMVILSIGLEPRKNIQDFAENIGIKLNDYHFCRSDKFTPLQTNRKGIFVCGGMNGPKDIPESVVAASGAVANAVKFLNVDREKKVTRKEVPEEKNVTGDRPRIGTFICHCGINIAGTVDVKKVAEEAKSLSHVEHSEDVMYACSQDCLDLIKKRIKEHDLNRIVVAACTPRTHEPLFRETIQEAGLNPYLFEMANIRDQCSWAHMNEPDLATRKSSDLVKMAVAKARDLSALGRLPIQITPEALVIGGGLAGMASSLSLAEAGYQVFLVERENTLGGNLRNIYFDYSGKSPQKLLNETIQKVRKHPNIRLFIETIIKDIGGYVGNYTTTVQNTATDEVESIKHGVVIVATGAKEHEPKEYLYRESQRVITQVEFEKMLYDGSFPNGRLKNVVMIQCVGSREEGKMYCSRVCCTKAVKNGLELKRQKPRTNLFVCYRDMRTYGFREEKYTELRDKGTLFFKYDLDNKPRVIQANHPTENGKLNVTAMDVILGKEIVIDADLVVLSTAIDALPDNEILAKMLKVPLNADGMFLEAHVKLRPVDFATDGVFVCGLAHSPKDIDESLAQAKAAASRALTFLTKKTILAEGTIAEVNSNLCSGCGYCEKVCAYNAIAVNSETQTAEVNDALCKGCGTCVASCRCGALDLRGFSNKQLFSVFNELDLVYTES